MKDMIMEINERSRISELKADAIYVENIKIHNETATSRIRKLMVEFEMRDTEDLRNVLRKLHEKETDCLTIFTNEEYVVIKEIRDYCCTERENYRRRMFTDHHLENFRDKTIEISVSFNEIEVIPRRNMSLTFPELINYEKIEKISDNVASRKR